MNSRITTWLWSAAVPTTWHRNMKQKQEAYAQQNPFPETSFILVYMYTCSLLHGLLGSETSDSNTLAPNCTSTFPAYFGESKSRIGMELSRATCYTDRLLTLMLDLVEHTRSYRWVYISDQILYMPCCDALQHARLVNCYLCTKLPHVKAKIAFCCWDQSSHSSSWLLLH